LKESRLVRYRGENMAGAVRVTSTYPISSLSACCPFEVAIRRSGVAVRIRPIAPLAERPVAGAVRHEGVTGSYAQAFSQVEVVERLGG
jgi:hypothetical protein